MRPVETADIDRIANEQFRVYVQRFCDAAQSLTQTMKDFKLDVESVQESIARRLKVTKLREQLVTVGAQVLNDGKSVVYGDRSAACKRCRTGVRSVSSFISLACNRQCWFCFNPNQYDWDRYRTACKDWRSEIEGLHRNLGGLDFVALTGGEPLLFPDEAVAFVRKAKDLSGRGHVRLYTSGDGLDLNLIDELVEAGLSEIRFSVKIDDKPECCAQTMTTISQCVGRIPYVMVEMPAQPGTDTQMQQLLANLDALGIFGVNLLELCFPLHNADEFRKRGLSLVRDPYEVPYSYGYAGALPVAGSEELALRLMMDAIQEGTQLSLHYCSLENKNTAQIFQQNHKGSIDMAPYRFSSRSFFYEMVRVFGSDAERIKTLLVNTDIAWETTGEGENCMVAFDPAGLAFLDAEAWGEATLFLASALFEQVEEGERFREVGLHVLEPEDAQRIVPLFKKI